VTEAQAVEAIYAAWSASWTSLHAGMEVVFGNEAQSAADTWIRVTVAPSTRAQGSMGPPGSRRFENRGRIAVQVFVPVDGGDAPLRGLCDDARTALETAALPQRDGSGNPIAGGETVVTFGAVTANISTDGRWYFATLLVPFLFWSQR
jgi:hypothetical protein